MTGYVDDIEEKTESNSNFRHVIYTGQHLQLVLMSLRPQEDIGVEVHETTDQFFRFESGEGKVIINSEEHRVSDDMVVIVPAGAQHNIINVSETSELKFYTIYAPPHHKDGTIHSTKSDAVADIEDHL